MNYERILLAHGAGARETGEILQYVLLSKISDSMKRIEGGYGIDVLDDAATIPLPNGEHMIITVDSYIVNPIFFPGGNIGKLAVCGSINDVLMMGGKPLAILDSIVVEEGFPINDLNEIVDSMINIAREEGVAIIGGDFKVMPQKQLDKIVITTVGIGISEKPIVDLNIKPGDKIIVTGTIGDHGASILALQHGIEVNSKDLCSDVQPLTRLMIPLLKRYGDYIHAAQDPTRGGLAMALNEWARKSGNIIVLDESKIPIRKTVQAYAEMLGIDPLSLASEGRALLGVSGEVADDILKFIRDLGFKDAEVIGEVRRAERYKGIVLLKTCVGSIRIVEVPSGELVPRIC